EVILRVVHDIGFSRRYAGCFKDVVLTIYIGEPVKLDIVVFLLIFFLIINTLSLGSNKKKHYLKKIFYL
ncbi:hypothetical protein ACQWF7_24810, partial [Salmonella enterica subsp. enterica serovar Infantis]